MLFNNSSFGKEINILTDNPFVQINEGELIPPPPPTTYFLLDNTGEILFDNTGEPLLVQG